MQTSFTDKQLLDKDNKTSETIIRKCVHCGMCNATCPTYGINGEELEGPRGRIYLIKDMLENKKPATKEITKHIDSCLSCYSCMTTCPSGVNYMHLIDHGRNYVEETYKRPFFDRLFRNILSFVLPRPNVFLLMALLSKIVKPFSFLFPKFLRNALNLMPNKIPGKKIKEKKVYEVTNGKKVSRVALLTGCVLPDINCCGSLNHHLGKKKLAHESFKNNIESWHEEYLKNGLDAIISNTSGCGTTLKDYGHIFKNDKDLKKKAKKISELTKDITEYLDENLKLNININNDKKYKIAYHSACSMQHGQKVHQQPKDLISKTGNEVLDIPEGHLCCGSAGTYNILHQKMAESLLKNKVKNIEKITPDFISTGNIGCMTQISAGTRIPIIHTVELLDWFTGGPKPYKLDKI
jgi:glycolate oxidase iron-sulfur subunit